jgi:hypothetical protein
LVSPALVPTFSAFFREIPASPALAAPHIGPARLPKPARARHQISEIGLGPQLGLQLPVAIVIQRQVTRKRWRFFARGWVFSGESLRVWIL